MIARCGNKGGHLSLMRNFVRELLTFKLEEQKEAAQQRGEGIGLKTPMDWPISDNGGWADATKLFGCDKPYNLAPRPAQREICGLAPKAATVATNVRPKQVCQPAKSNSVLSTGICYNAWFNTPGWLKPALKPVGLALEPLQRAAILLHDTITLKQETGNKTPSTELLPSKERKVQTIKAPDEWFQTYAVSKKLCLAQSLGSRKLFPLKRQKQLLRKASSSFSRCKLETPVGSKLQQTNGRCQEQGCGVQHPGFCILCSRLYKLQATGSQEQKVLVKAVVAGVIGLHIDASSFFLGAKTQQQSKPVSISRKRPKQTYDATVLACHQTMCDKAQPPCWLGLRCKGRVELSARFNALQDRPQELLALLYNRDTASLRWQKELVDRSLAYNNNISFGHIETQRGEEEIYRIVKCNNMIQYVLWDYNPPDGSMPLLHGQLFTIPSDQAHERLGQIAADSALDASLLIFLHDLLRKYHPLAAAYETAAETYNQMPVAERIHLRMLVVGTNRQGESQAVSSTDAPPVNVTLPDASILRQIHPGRLAVETEAGSHLVAQFYIDSGQNVIPSMDYEVVLKGRKGTGKLNMKWWHREIDPALFPLLFSRGQYGYEDGIPLKLQPDEHFDKQYQQIRQGDNALLDEAAQLGEEEEFLGSINERKFSRRDRVSRAQLFRYMAQIRGPNWKTPHWLWDWGGLAQLYTVTFNNRSEARKFYQKEYANCMTICRDIGKPDLLVTYTMDPDCPEILEMLPTDSNGKQQQWYDRPDIVTRLFIDKLKELEKDLTQRCVMGPVKGWFYAVEHQKRGLPHVHFCLIMDWERMRAGGKIQTPEDYIDEYVCAEIPPKPEGRTKEARLSRQLHEIITKKNIHTCTAKRCLVDGKCNKHFPKPYEYDNIYSDNAYPRYRRRPPPPDEAAAKQNPEQFGRVFEYKDRWGRTVRKDNAHVVAYNPYLSAKYRSHINVEFVAGDGCTKYICKYCMKGGDMAFVEVTKDGNTKWDYDEYHQIRLARYITSAEAAMSLWGTPLVRRSHVVDQLDVHGPEGHLVAVDQSYADEEERENAICEAAQREEERRATGEERVTQLTAYFAYNRDRSSADGPLHLTYATCYKKLRFDLTKRRWQAYAIRLLLLVVEDPTGWEDLRRHAGVVYPTFLTAAQARGLLSDNELWKRTIREAFDTKKTAKKCIRWLAVFFATANLTKPTELLEYVMEIADQWLTVPRLTNTSLDAKQQYVLRSLEWFLLANGVRPCPDKRADETYESACEHIGLPRPEGVALSKDDYLQLAFFRDDLLYDRIPEEMREGAEQHIGMKRRYEELFNAGPNPNEEQHTLIEDIYKGVEAAQLLRRGSQSTATSTVPRLFMVTGEGGAGKTFTYNKIIAKTKAAGFNFLPMATTGIAAELLYEGQTVHKRLCRAKHIDSSTPLNVDQESHFAEMLRNIDGMIIDEISMQHRDVLEYVDRLLRFVAPTDFLKSLPFAGKAVVIGGDWKQLTPVILGGGHLDQLDASVKNSILFKHFTTRRLVANHRLQAGQQRYRDFIKRVGIGIINDNRQFIKLPVTMVEPDREKLLKATFPDELLKDPLDNWEELAGRAILCPLNRETFELNDIIMDQLETTERTYTGVTTPIVDIAGANELENALADINIENLARMTPPGIPEHHLRVKVGSIMMINTNVSLEEGLCNGTRVQICKLGNNILRCKIMTGKHRGLIKCERIQFPLRPGSVMTINKSQGQTLTHVGVLLDKSQCFSHGQLYTALSRVRDSANIRVCTKRADRRIRNVVMTELLDKEDLESAPEVDANDPDNPYPRAPPKDGTNIDNLKMIKIVKGDITKQVAYMIVNDKRNDGNGAFLRACEPSSSEYLEALNAVLPPSAEPAPDGFVGVTPTFGKLHTNVSYIAHAVAPIIQGAAPTPANIQGLQACYKNALQAMSDANKAESEQLPRKIAFPCVGIKAAGFPRDVAAKAAFEAILNWLVENPIDAELIDEIRLVPFDKSDAGLYRDVWAQLKRLLNARRSTSRSSRSSSATTSRASSPATTPQHPKFEALDAKPCTSATDVLPAKRQLYSQLSSSSVIACHPPMLQQQQKAMDIQPSASHYPGGRASETRIEGDGNCFFSAVCTSVFGEEIHSNTTAFRQRLFGFLNLLLGNQQLFPRAHFGSRQEFMQRLQRQLIDDGTLEAYAALRLTDRNWAQINDSILVALLLQRPVVVLSPTMSVNDCALLGPRWNDTRCAQFMHVFFPDGQMRRIIRTTPHDQLQHFTMQQELAPGQIDTREVTPSVHNTAEGLDIILDQTHVPVAMTLPGLMPAQQQPTAEVSRQQQEEPMDVDPSLTVPSAARPSTPSAPGGARDVLDIHQPLTSGSESECNEAPKESVPPTSAHLSKTDIAIEAAKRVINLNARLLHPLRLEMEQNQQKLLAAQAADAKPMLLSQPNFLKLKRQQRAAIERLQKELNFAREQFQSHLEEARKIEAVLKSAADTRFRVKQKKRLTEFIEETPVAGCPPVKQQCCEQISECADHFYNTVWTFICLWYTLMQIDPDTASLECLTDWRKQSGRCSSKLYRLQDAWEDNASLLEEELEKTAKYCREFKPQKQMKSGISGALKTLFRKLASRRPASLPKPTDQLFRALFNALHQKDRAAKLQRIEQQLKQHIHRQKNLAVRNLMWDREAALEHRIRERYHAFRQEIVQLRQSAFEIGNLDNYEHCLASDAAVNAFCQELIDLASLDANADVDEQIRKHKEVIEREERGLAEQQRWRNFAYEQRGLECRRDEHCNKYSNA
uniref:ATP-dependent DNA helicase n=1 Tax=Globodera pallida TaxID=36090 RepID=A0A183BNP0_GLOPA